VGVQGDSLYYLDPHHTRATIPLRPPLSTLDSNGDETDSGGPGFRSASEDLHGTTGRSAWKNRTKQLRRQSTSASDSKSRPSRDIRQRTPTSPPPELNPRHSPVSPSPLSNSVSTRQLPTSTSIHSQLSSTGSTSSMANTVQGDPLLQHYCTAYTMPELNTFHCDKVRKMPVSSLDPSMLLGFLCRNEDDWKDFRARVDRVRVAALFVLD
jgi:cysteine protease ATG4